MAFNQGDTATPNLNINSTSYTQINPGPYIGVIKSNDDPSKMGTLKVSIPSLSNTNNPSSDQLYIVRYLPHFYGVKSTAGVDATDITKYDSSQHSYGMWMNPPDVDTRVMVIFVEGNVSEGYWIGCVPEPYMNSMIPGIASDKTYDEVQANELSGTPNQTGGFNRIRDYGTDVLPTGEANRGDFASSSALGVDKLKKPMHPFADVLRKQGLTQDTVRGTSTSSIRRESPSSVFGISTPGRINKRSKGKKTQVGPSDKKEIKQLARESGHTFVLDDGDAEGNNQLVRLRSASGHQLLMNDTAGVVYLANSDGSVWMEFSKSGMVDIYAQLGYNIRSGGNINFHAEGDINMYANNNIKIKANEKKGRLSLDADVLRGIGRSAVQLDSDEGILTLRSKHSLLTQSVQGNQIHQAAGRVDLVGDQIHFNSIGKSDLVPGLSRTSFAQPTGTGTQTVGHQDVTPRFVGELHTIDRELTGLTGMRVPTHEPYWGHLDRTPIFSSVGGSSTATGTAGALENSNRNSDLFSIRFAQAEADLNAEIEKNVSGSINSIANIFKADYSKRIGLPESISSSFNDYKRLGKGEIELFNRLVDSTGVTNTSNIGQVLATSSGIIYAKGTDAAISVIDNATGGTLGKAQSVVKSAGSVVNTVNSTIQSVNQVNTAIKSVNKITDTYTNVIGSQVTQVTQVSNVISNIGTTVASVARSIGKIFRF